MLRSLLYKILFFLQPNPKKSVKGQFDLHILIYKEGGQYVAHCLELDIVGCGTNLETAFKEMQELVETQIEFHFRHGIENKLFHPAPAEYWNKWLKAERCELPRKSLPDKVESLKCALVEENDLIPA